MFSTADHDAFGYKLTLNFYTERQVASNKAISSFKNHHVAQQQILEISHNLTVLLQNYPQNQLPVSEQKDSTFSYTTSTHKVLPVSTFHHAKFHSPVWEKRVNLVLNCGPKSNSVPSLCPRQALKPENRIVASSVHPPVPNW